MFKGLEIHLSILGMRKDFQGTSFIIINNIKGPELPMVKVLSNQFRLVIPWLDIFAAVLTNNRSLTVVFRIYLDKEKVGYYDFTNTVSLQIVNGLANVTIQPKSQLFRVELANGQQQIQLLNLQINDLTTLKVKPIEITYNLKLINITKIVEKKINKTGANHPLSQLEQRTNFSIFYYNYKVDNTSFDLIGICDTAYITSQKQLNIMYYYHHALPNDVINAFRNFLFRLIYPSVEDDFPFAIQGDMQKMGRFDIGFNIGLAQQITKSGKPLFCLIPVVNGPSNLNQLLKKDIKNDLRFFIREEQQAPSEIQKIVVAGYSGGGVHAINTWLNHKQIIDELYLVDPSDAEPVTKNFVSLNNKNNIGQWLNLSTQNGEISSAKKLRIIWGLEGRLTDYFNLANSLDSNWRKRFDFMVVNKDLPIYIYPKERQVLQNGLGVYESYHLALVPIIKVTTQFDAIFYQKLICFDNISDKGRELFFLSKLTNLYWDSTQDALITGNNIQVPKTLPMVPQVGKAEFIGFTVAHWLLNKKSVPNTKQKIADPFAKVAEIIQNNFIISNPYLVSTKNDVSVFIVNMATHIDSYFNPRGITLRHQWPARGGFWSTSLKTLAMSKRGLDKNDGDFQGHFYMFLRDSTLV